MSGYAGFVIGVWVAECARFVGERERERERDNGGVGWGGVAGFFLLCLLAIAAF